MTGRPLRFLTFIICAVVVGTGGYVLYRSSIARGQLTLTLAAAHASLAERERLLQESQAQLAKLTQDHEAAGRQHAARQQEIARLTNERERLRDQLSDEHHTKAQLLASAQADVEAYQERLAALGHTHEVLQAKQQALERAAMRRDARSLTPAELAQVSQQLTRQQRQVKDLTQELADRSRAYDQLAAEHTLLEQGIAAHPPQPGSSWALQLASKASALSLHEVELAARYRELGESYQRLGDYERAAAAFERSLALREDPALHTRLSLLYSRFLHRSEPALQHAAQSPVIPSINPGDAAKAQQLPRSGWQLLWRWLTNS